MPAKVSYTQEDRERIIDHVLAELCSGRAVSRTLAEDEGMPSERTWWNWYHQSDAEDANGLIQKVARARECGIEAKIDRALDIAAHPMIGEIRIDKHLSIGGEALPVTEVRHEDMLGHRKLLVESTFKAAQMLKPKTYGPKLDLTSGGEKLSLAAEVEAARRRTMGEEQGQ